MNTFLLLLAVVVLVLLNGFFVAAEYALITARRGRLEEKAEAGGRSAQAAVRLMNEPVLSNLLEEWLAVVISVAIAFFLITFMHVVVGELVPKGIALNYAERVSLAVSTPVRAFFFVFNPLIWFLQRSSELLQRALGIDPYAAEHQAHSEAELKMLLSVSTEQGQIAEGEQEMLYKVFDFADKEASDVMVPRPDVVAISVDMPPEEALAAVLESPFTRYPVFRESPDEIVGILHVRDLISALNDRGIAQVELAELLRPTHFVPETKDLAALLGEFRRLNQHMAVVVDEYGAMEGIVTLEDLLEEIVGEIEDEYDLPDEAVERIDDTTIRIGGTFPIDDFNEQFGRALPVEDYHTIGGFVFGLLGRQPEPGDEAAHDGCRFKVLEVEGSRIERVEVELDEPQREQRLEEAS